MVVRVDLLFLVLNIGLKFSSNQPPTPTPLCPCQVAQIVKKEMESAVKLYVKLKAKVKAGPSWGNLQDLDI